MAHLDRFQVFATSMQKQNMVTKQKILDKAKGYLEKQYEMLEKKLDQCSKEIVDIKKNLNNTFKNTGILAAEARFAIGGFNPTIISTATKPRVKVISRKENIFGVETTTFRSDVVGADQFNLFGLAKGGAKVNALKQAYVNAIELVAQLASAQNTFLNLETAYKETKRKANAIEHKSLPKVKNTIRYIEYEIDEREREEYFRLKLIKRLQQAKQTIKEKEEHEDEVGDKKDSPKEKDTKVEQGKTKESEQEDTSIKPMVVDKSKVPNNLLENARQIIREKVDYYVPSKV